MADILVTEREDEQGRFDVTLTDGASVTQHEVAADLAVLGLTDHDPRLVVEESFRFLLEREPKEAIMAAFDLSAIGSFFPEYCTEIRKRMRGEPD